jgi:hypothetical protein
MARGWVHTVHKAGVWVNEIEDVGEMSSHHTKEEAVEAGRELARLRHTEHLIHHVDGTVAERNSYGGDPFPPAG